jgi:DNA modification methylase
MIEFLIKNFSDKDDIVFDTFIGSGTTAIAAQNINRKFIGIEKDETYFNTACKRIKENEDRLKNNNILESLF